MPTKTPDVLMWTRKAVSESTTTNSGKTLVKLRGVSGTDYASVMLVDHWALPAIAAWLQEPGRIDLLRRVLSASLDQPVLDDVTEADAIYDLFTALEQPA